MIYPLYGVNCLYPETKHNKNWAVLGRVQIARKTAEERRILQKADPTDAITVKTRRLFVAERRQSASLQQHHRQHEQSLSRAGRKQSFLLNQQQENKQLQPPEAGRRQSCQQDQHRQLPPRVDSGPDTSQSRPTPRSGELAAGIAAAPALQPMPDLTEEGDCLDAVGDD